MNTAIATQVSTAVPIEHPDIRYARCKAVKRAGEWLSDDDYKFWNGMEKSLRVRCRYWNRRSVTRHAGPKMEFGGYSTTPR